MNRGLVGARALNLELQVAMNPAGERKVERFGWTFSPLALLEALLHGPEQLTIPVDLVLQFA
jgi:hypothetical protein